MLLYEVHVRFFNTVEEEEYDVQSTDVLSLYPYVTVNKEYPYIEEILE